MAFFFVLTVWIVLTAGAAALFLPDHPQSFVVASLLLFTIYVVIFLVPSFRFGLVRRLGIRLAAFYLGTFSKTYVTATDRKDLTGRYERAGRLPELKEYLGQGMTWLGLPDVLYLQWPFYSVVQATTAQLRIRIEATDNVWTTEQEIFRIIRTTRITKKDAEGHEISSDEQEELGDWQVETATTRKPPSKKEKKLEKSPDQTVVETIVDSRTETQVIPRIQLHVNGEIFIRLGVNLGPFTLALPDAPLDRSTGENNLETFLAGKIQPLIFEAIRTGVAGYKKRDGTFVPGLTWEGLADAVKARRELEVRVREILGSEPESILIQSGLLREWDGNPETPDNGQSAAAFDIVIEEIAPKEPKLQEAIDAVAVARKQAEAARYDGDATRQRERGLTDALVDRKSRLEVGGDIALAHDFGKATKANLTLVATDVVAALAAFFQKRRK